MWRCRRLLNCCDKQELYTLKCRKFALALRRKEYNTAIFFMTTTVLSTLHRRILQSAHLTIETEAAAILHLKQQISETFVQAVHLLSECKGRVIVTGVGKSAIIAQKIVATLNSTGTVAAFLHAADALHGDLGMVQAQDVIIAISKSGSTAELLALAPFLKRNGNLLIAIVSNEHSNLAKYADCVLLAKIEREACPNNLAPTASTTAQLAMGDALAMCLQDLKHFTPQDFAFNHPAGALGKQLYLKVEDFYRHQAKPQVLPTASLQEVIVEISSKRLGAVAVVEEDSTLVGIITDGDVRRMLERSLNVEMLQLRAEDIMNKQPKTIENGTMAAEALNILRHHNINQMIVVQDKKYVGMIHLHDLLREGLE